MSSLSSARSFDFWWSCDCQSCHLSILQTDIDQILSVCSETYQIRSDLKCSRTALPRSLPSTSFRKSHDREDIARQGMQHPYVWRTLYVRPSRVSSMKIDFGRSRFSFVVSDTSSSSSCCRNNTFRQWNLGLLTFFMTWHRSLNYTFLQRMSGFDRRTTNTISCPHSMMSIFTSFSPTSRGSSSSVDFVSYASRCDIQSLTLNKWYNRLKIFHRFSTCIFTDDTSSSSSTDSSGMELRTYCCPRTGSLIP